LSLVEAFDGSHGHSLDVDFSILQLVRPPEHQKYEFYHIHT
jgi:hypothetical protein